MSDSFQPHELQHTRPDSIIPWQIDGESMETVTDFIFFGSKFTADGDHSHEIKRRLLLGRKAMTNLDSILKSRDITLLTKICLVKAMVFPVVTFGCEIWAIKKAESQRIDTFELWCWRRLLRVPWMAGRLNQSVWMKSVLNIHWKDWCWSSKSLAILKETYEAQNSLEVKLPSRYSQLFYAKQRTLSPEEKNGH